MLTKAIDLLNLTDFSSWWNPLEMWDRGMAIDMRVSRGDLIAGAGFHKFRETLPISTFAVGFNDWIQPVQVRMRDEGLLDFELQVDNHRNYEFELVTVYEDGRKPGAEHRNLSDDSQEVIKKPSIMPIDLQPIVRQVTNKTRKLTDKKRGLAINDKKLRRHLLVNCSIFGGGVDARQLCRQVSVHESAWESIWVICGVPDTSFMALLCDSFGFHCPKGEWLPNWKWAHKRLMSS